MRMWIVAVNARGNVVGRVAVSAPVASAQPCTTRAIDMASSSSAAWAAQLGARGKRHAENAATCRVAREPQGSWSQLMASKIKRIHSLATAAISDPLVAMDLPKEIESLSDLASGADSVLEALQVMRNKAAERTARKQERDALKKEMDRALKLSLKKQRARESRARAKAHHLRAGFTDDDYKALLAKDRRERRARARAASAEQAE